MMCRIYQMWINRALDDGRKLSAGHERHLVHCERCRDHYERQLSVVRSLCETTSQRSAEPSAFLHARILNEITNQSLPESSTRSASWAWAAGMAAAIAVAVIIVQSQTRRTADLAAVNPAIGATAPNAAAALLENTVRFANGGQLLQAVTDLDQPLQTEMNLVISDARAALRSLQADFVPAQLLARSE